MDRRSFFYALPAVAALAALRPRSSGPFLGTIYGCRRYLSSDAASDGDHYSKWVELFARGANKTLDSIIARSL